MLHQISRSVTEEYHLLLVERQRAGKRPPSKMSKFIKEHKLVLVGRQGAGKSSLCNWIVYVYYKGPDYYDPTLEDSCRKQVDLDGEKHIMDNLDTVGFEEYEAMRDMYIKLETDS